MTENVKMALLVSFYFPPIVSAGVHRTLRFTRFLPEYGWMPSILTSTPNADTPLDSKLASTIPADVEVNHEALVRPEEVFKERAGLLFGRRRKDKHSNQSMAPQFAKNETISVSKEGPSAVRRARNIVTELLFAIPDDRVGWKSKAVARGLEIVREQNASVIYATAPPFSSLLVGREIARKTNLPLVIDFRDPWTRVPWGPRNKSWLANRWVARLERACVRDAAAVVLNTPELEEDFVRHYPSMPREKFVSITNGFDPNVRTRAEAYIKTEELPPRNGRPFRLLHPGSLYRNRDPRPIIDAIAKLKQKGIPVILEQVGHCDANFELLNYAAERGVAELIAIKPAIPNDQMLQRMGQVDGFVLLQPGTALQIPGKLFEMILFRKPILAICVPGAVSNIINEFQIGTIAKAGNVDSIVDAIERLESAEESTPQWDAALAKFDGRHLTQQLANVFDSVS